MPTAMCRACSKRTGTASDRSRRRMWVLVSCGGLRDGARVGASARFMAGLWCGTGLGGGKRGSEEPRRDRAGVFRVVRPVAGWLFGLVEDEGFDLLATQVQGAQGLGGGALDVGVHGGLGQLLEVLGGAGVELVVEEL